MRVGKSEDGKIKKKKSFFVYSNGKIRYDMFLFILIKKDDLIKKNYFIKSKFLDS